MHAPINLNLLREFQTVADIRQSGSTSS